MGELKLMLVGAGRIGTIHFVNMLTNQRASIRWVVEIDVNRAKQLVSSYNMEDKVKVISVDKVTEILTEDSVDGVMVCTPHSTHAEIVKQALIAGKPVFCEKPLSLKFKESKECYDLAKSTKLPLMCAFNRRFDPDHEWITQHIQQGAIGSVRAIHYKSRDPRYMINRPYLETSGGIFLDAMVHQIDLVCHMLGEKPLTVYATGHATHPMFTECNDVDTAIAVLKFPGGAVASLEFSRCVHINHDQRLEVLGTTGMLQVPNRRPLEVLEWNTSGVHQEPIYDGLERFSQSFKLEIEHFIDVLQGKCELQVKGSSTLTTFLIAKACKESLDNQKVIVLREFAKENYNYTIEDCVD